MRRLRIRTIRARLLVGFVAMALVPTIGISAGSIGVGYYNGQQQALQRLESVAALKELEIRGWMDSLQRGLFAALNEEYALERASVMLDLAQEDKYYDFHNHAMRERFRILIGRTGQFQELFLLDLHGQVTLSTDVAEEGQSYSDQAFFDRGLRGPYVQLPFDPGAADPCATIDENNAALQGCSAVFVAVPIVDQDGRLWGVLAGRASAEALYGILRERMGLGRTGKTYLVDANHSLLTDGSSGDASGGIGSARSIGIDAAVERQVDGSGAYEDYRGVRVVGAYRWLPELRVALLAEQDLSEAFQGIVATLGVNMSIALGAVVLAVGASLFITRGIANPLVNLVATATQIADGDLERVAEVEREDEVGTLAQTFNTMTAQLRDLINSLEQRVQERTQALQDANAALRRRALQLETSAQVSREVTSILDINDLLTHVVALIQKAFGYYHVHIYLVDEESNHLILRASSGAVSPELERLAIGKGSLNSEAARANEALLVNDVTQDPRYLADPELPDTRSELVIPLRVGDRMIGTLDVQSTEPHAFIPEDVLVIQSLGDQIAIAIENARLYDRSRELAVLEERNRLARELHDSVTHSLYSLGLLAEGWRRLASSGKTLRPEDFLSRIGEITNQALKEMRLLIHELRPPALEREGLLGALHQRLDAVENRAGVEARILAEDLVELPAEVEEGLYRIALEALNNALKHAAASKVTVHVRIEGAYALLEVRDNGRGFDPEAVRSGGGMGLTNMRERAKQLGGAVVIQSAPGEGTTVKTKVMAGAARSDPAPANADDSEEVTQ